MDRHVIARTLSLAQECTPAAYCDQLQIYTRACAHVQAYYDERLEPFFTRAAPHLKELQAAVPPPAALAILFGFDVLLVAGLGLWALGSLAGAGALLAAAAAVAVARERKLKA